MEKVNRFECYALGARRELTLEAWLAKAEKEWREGWFTAPIAEKSVADAG